MLKPFNEDINKELLLAAVNSVADKAITYTDLLVVGQTEDGSALRVAFSGVSGGECFLVTFDFAKSFLDELAKSVKN